MEMSDGYDGGSYEGMPPLRYHKRLVERGFFLELLRYLAVSSALTVRETDSSWQQSVTKGSPRYSFRWDPVYECGDVVRHEITRVRLGDVEFVKQPMAPAGKPADLQRPAPDRLQEREV